MDAVYRITQNTFGKAEQQPLANMPVSITSEQMEVGHLRAADPTMQLLTCSVVPRRHMKSFTLNKEPERFICFKVSQ